MSETLPDVTTPSTSFIDINTTLSIPVGKAFWIQNKGTGIVYIQKKNTTPLAASTDGSVLASLNFYYVESGSPRIWAKGGSKVNVQVDD